MASKKAEEIFKFAENEVKAVKVAVLAPHGVSTTPHVSCTMQLIGHTLLCVGRTRQSWELQEGLRDPRGVGGLLYMKHFYGLELLNPLISVHPDIDI